MSPGRLQGARVCLVTSGPVGSDPRLVKEAHALHEAGAQVRVVATDATGLAVVAERDARVLRGVPWRFAAVPVGGVGARKWRAVLRRAARALWRAGLRTRALTQMAYDPLIGAIARTAAAEPAELYIAHNLAALPAAARAAETHGALLGFDAEDFHSGQLMPNEALLLSLTRALERDGLARCHHVTAASPGIADAYAPACPAGPPVVVLNVFPRAEAPPPPAARPSAQQPSLYWFSQTLGPQRGLESVIAAVGASRCRPRLVLQGSVHPGYEAQLHRLAAAHGVADRLHLLPPAPPDELARIASQHDAGLATEPTEPANRDLCLTNKLFTYLLAGIPVLASDTTAQRGLAARLPSCMWAGPLHDTQAWAAAIDRLLLDPSRLAEARRAAWEAGQTLFNWDQERQVFLRAVEAALERR